MTELLYFDDSYAMQFAARVVQRLRLDGQMGLILDRTYFYPSSGGQPHDLGHIGQCAVSDVYFQNDERTVVHLVSDFPLAEEIEAEVEWPRRFDHMQQHSGQHILSQALERVAGAHTVGFHMSAESSTLDLDLASLSAAELGQAEALANEIVWENRPISVRYVTHDEAHELPLRRLPDAKGDLLRLITIDSFDMSACGGTHVRHTGEIGMIKVLKTERQGNKLRIEFLCGSRALADYAEKNAILSRLSTEMTTSHLEIENTYARLRQELKEANKKNKQLRAQIARFEAASLVTDATEIAGTRLICKVFEDSDPQALRRLASQLTRQDDTIVLFGLAGEKAQLLLARSDNMAISMNDVLTDVLPVLGRAAGGGSAKFAQGGGPAADEAQLRKALERAEAIVRRQLGEA